MYSSVHISVVRIPASHFRPQKLRNLTGSVSSPTWTTYWVKDCEERNERIRIVSLQRWYLILVNLWKVLDFRKAWIRRRQSAQSTHEPHKYEDELSSEYVSWQWILFGRWNVSPSITMLFATDVFLFRGNDQCIEGGCNFEVVFTNCII